jgi:hypothetical protein
MNVSMQGLVKIGRTQRDPDERARELSAATGVPTPFVLVFDAYFQDSARAEAYVHTLLETRNYRVTNNREFFVAPVKEAILAIQAAEKLLGTASMPEPDSPVADAEPSPAEPPWTAILGLADNAHYGVQGTLQDDAEALHLYKQAARLGSGEACLTAAQILMQNEQLRDLKQALIYLKEGARHGNGDCHAEMASIFAGDGHRANWELCWSNYFASDTFRKRRSTVFFRGLYGLNYIEQARQLFVPLDHLISLAEIKDEVFSALDYLRAAAIQQEQPTVFYNIRRHYVRQAFGEDEGTATLHGQINWLKPEEKYAATRLDSGDDAIITFDNIMIPEVLTHPASLEGMRVQCQVIQSPSGGLIAFDVRREARDPRPDALGRL